MDMDDECWGEVDAYLENRLHAAGDGLVEVLAANAAAGLPAIDISPLHGKLLHLLARMAQARRALEIGTLGGYSTIWLARALPEDGRVVTLEAEPRHAAVARENYRRAGVLGKIDLRVGRAVETLPKLADEGLPPFDLVFIDADKPNNPAYLDWALKLSRPGTVIVVDNVVRDGRILQDGTDDATVNGVRRMFDIMHDDARLTATAVQTVGAKGWDGFAVAVVNGG